MKSVIPRNYHSLMILVGISVSALYVLGISNIRQLFTKKRVKCKRRNRQWPGQPNGLFNTGSYLCHVNAVLQALASSTQFIQGIKKFHTNVEQQNEVHCRSNNFTNVLVTLLETINDADSSDHCSITSALQDIYDAIRQMGWQMNYGFQQDAHEMLNILQMSLERDTTGIITECGPLPFVGGLVNSVERFSDMLTCHTDAKKEIKEERVERSKHSFNNITLHFDDSQTEHSDSVTLQKLLKKFVEREKISTGSSMNDILWKESRFDGSNLPKLLCIHIQRTALSMTNGTASYYKRDEHVKFNTILDLSPFLSPNKDSSSHHLYRLTAVIQHVGSSLDSGHYITYRRSDTELNRNWFKCSDDSVVKVDSVHDVLDAEAYLLFYESSFNSS